MSAANEPAFPVASVLKPQGITKREYFAAKALGAAYLAVATGTPATIARHAVAIADALLAALAEEAKP